MLDPSKRYDPTSFLFCQCRVETRCRRIGIPSTVLDSAPLVIRQPSFRLYF
jgi:hypothetical protein